MHNHSPPRYRTVAGLYRITTRTVAVMAFAAVAAAMGSASTWAAAPYIKADKPITDEQGRIHVTINFSDDAPLMYPQKLMPLPRTKQDGEDRPIEFFHKPQAEALVADVEKAYGFERTGMTSWVGTSVTTFATLDQVKRLQDDERVKTIYDDVADRFSWADSTVSGETTSWGHQAVNGQVRTVSNNRKVYIIDSGVAEHYDLTSLAPGLNVACGAYNCNASNPSTYPLVGCYAHATHVAGIIGAQSGNGLGTNGVYAGANMVSLSVLVRTGGDMCAASNDITGTSQDVYRSRIGNAFDYIYWDTLYNNSSQLVNVVNISINSAGLSIDSGGPQVNWARVQSVATPALESVYIGCSRPQNDCTYEESHQDYYFAGAFVAQSSGNEDSDLTCVGNYSLGNLEKARRHYLPYAVFGETTASDPYDGIMVVGAIDIQANRAAPFPATAFTIGELGSNFGPCVDIFAPGKAIYSTWGALSGNTIVGTSYSNIASISGTSMAAPHVVAAAAHYADTYGLSTPRAIEEKIRDKKNPSITTLDVVKLW